VVEKYESNTTKLGSLSEKRLSDEVIHGKLGKGKELELDRIRAVTIKTPILVEGEEVKAVIDTGAEVTVISEAKCNEIPKEKRPVLKKATNGLVVAEAGKKMTTYGLANLKLKIGKLHNI